MIDWMMLVNNLRANYKSLSAIARELESTEKHMNRIARGEVKEPRFNTGLKLLDMHLKYCGIEKHKRLVI